MKNYLFTDDIAGEDFIVQADTIGMAQLIAIEYFDEPRYIAILTETEIEMSGLDLDVY